MLRNNADARRCSYFELGLPVAPFQRDSTEFFLFVLFPVHEVHYPFRDLLVYPGAPGLSHHAITSIIVIRRRRASHITKNACSACK